jgi:CheY-like chemotaxis protein
MVDDEPHVHEAIQRRLGDKFEIVAALDGPSALELLARTEAPFAVIVSDMRMPVMDGAAFLARARELSRTSTRLLLTGDADLKSAINAVNEGHIFRFLCKPCPSDVLRAALEAGVEQHALVIAERDIMERTLSAVVKTLGDVLSLTDPELFNRATLVKAYVSHVVRHLQIEGAWQIEVAAALHSLGMIALPAELGHRTKSSSPLTVDEKKQLDMHPATASRIIGAIPRLEDVALIVAQQANEEGHGPEWVRRGARILRLAIRLEGRVSRGVTLGEALDTLSSHASEEERAYLAALRTLYADSEQMQRKELRARDLNPGMILDGDVKTQDGALVLPKGRELSAVLIERLLQFSAARRLEEPIAVRVSAAPETASIARRVS